MVLRIILPFLLSTFLGASLALNLVPERRYRAVVLWASPAIGIGLSAHLFFLWFLAFQPAFAGPAYFGLELLLAFCGFLILFRRLKRGEERVPVQASEHRLKSYEGLLGGVFALSLVFFTILFFTRVLESPYGEWDAWAIWNMRARYLFTGGPDWRHAFSEYLQGADYPVLSSLYIARTWIFVGQDVVAVPQILAGIFAVTTIGLLVAAVSKARGRTQALIAGIVLACTPSFIYWSTSQYADIPLGCYFLAANIFLFFTHTSEKSKPGLPVISGLLVGFALWTKNEGLFILIAFAVTQAVYLLVSRQRMLVFRNWAWFLAGIFPAVVVLTVFKLFVVPPNYVFNQTAGNLLSKLTDSDRYQDIYESFLGQFLSFGGWKIPLIPLMLVYGVLAGVHRNLNEREKRGLVLLLGTLALIVMGYAGAYLVTTLTLDWQLKESIERLLMQVFPSVLFLIFVVLRNPLE